MHTGTALDAGRLIACLEGLPPVELLGLALLRQSRSTADGWFPQHIPMTEVVQATVEMVAYSSRATQVAQKLAGLRPIPLNVPVLEFPL